MAWTSEEVESMAECWFEAGGTRCPQCRGHVYVKEIKPAGRPCVDLAMDCRRCGDSARWDNPQLSRESWSAEEIRDIVAAWRADGEARCTADRALLTVQEHDWVGAPRELAAHCKRCGRFFRLDAEETVAA